MTSTTLLSVLVMDKSTGLPCGLLQSKLFNPDLVPEQVYGMVAGVIMAKEGKALDRTEFEARFNYLAIWRD